MPATIIRTPRRRKGQIGCKRPVRMWFGRYEDTVPCGTFTQGETQLCQDCQAEAERKYPQGWRAYPGDTCKHGVYVGGCGVDWMCGQCEMGE